MSTVKTDNVVGSFTPLPVINSANAVETYLASAGQTVFTTTKFDQTSAIKVFAKVGSNFVEVVATWASLNTVTISGITLTAGQKVYVYSVSVKANTIQAKRINNTFTSADVLLNELETKASYQAVSPNDFAYLVTSKPTPTNPATWDWKPAFVAMFNAVSTGLVKVINLSGVYRIVGGLAPTQYEWTGVTIVSAGASIVVDTPVGDGVGLQIGSNVSIKGLLKGSVINGTSNGNGFVRTPICIGRWWDSVEVSNVTIDSLTLAGMINGTAIAIGGNTHGVRIGRLDMTNGQIGLVSHWAGLPNNTAPVTTYHPHDIHIGTINGSGFTESLVTLSACYDITIDYINGSSNYRDFNHIGGDFGQVYAVARDAGKVCKGVFVGRIDTVGSTYRCVDYNASAGLVSSIMQGEFSIRSVKALGTGAASSVGIRIENRESGSIGFADVSGFDVNIVQFNCNGGNDGELISSNSLRQGITFSSSKHLKVNVLRTVNDNQSAGGGVGGIGCSATCSDIEVQNLIVSTNNASTHGCVLNSGASNIRINQVTGTVDASRSLLVDKSAPNVNRIGPCFLDSGAISYNGPDSFSSKTSRGNVTGWGGAIPTAGTFKKGDVLYNTTVTASGKVGWVCITSGTPGSWKAFGVVDA